ncbi:MAG: acetolactate synthase large subunit, partial [Alcanivoracaceae bacterium]
SGENIPARIREAFRLAEEERPGATHLELPEDIAREHSTMPVLEPSQTRRPIAEEKAIRNAAEAITAARKPLLLIGAAANRKLTSKMLRQFVEKLGIPAVTTQMGKGVIDETGPHFVGNTALSDGDFVHRAIDQADLIINVGHDVVEKPPFFMRPGGPEVVHINFNSAQVDPVYFPQIEVVGDIANSLWQLKERLSPQKHWSFSDFHRIRDALEKHIADGKEDDRFPTLPQRLVHEVRRVMPEDGIIALDNGMYKIWFARNYPASSPNTVLLDNALATMGAGLPSAMAAKLVHPEKRVLAVCGDGGFMMNSQELETAVRLKLDIVVLILRDDAYGMIKWKQAQMDYHDFGLDFGNPDFVAYARAYGASGHLIESTADIAPTLERCFNEGGVHVVDAPVDYTDNDRILNNEIRELSSKV